MALPDSTATRERRVMLIGASIAVTALVLVYGVLPFARHWSLREREVESATARVAYLEQLVSRATTLESSATIAEGALSVTVRRVMHARSATLAASAVQTMLQEAADASALVVTRLDVTADDSLATMTDAAVATAVTDGGISGASPSTVASASLSIPATLSAYGDITGVAHLLGLLSAGPRVVRVERLTMIRNSALAGAPDVVQVTMTLRVPVVPQ